MLTRRSMLTSLGTLPLLTNCATSPASETGSAPEAATAVKSKTIYRNALSSAQDVADFILEGDADLDFNNQALRITNTRPPSDGQAANIVFWCDQIFQGDIEVSWEFRPVREPGLCVFFLAAEGAKGEDLFSDSLAPRAGLYNQYIRGDIKNIGLSYFRRRHAHERAFSVCNLRHNPGFHLVGQAADPLPSLTDWPETIFYRFLVRKIGRRYQFQINDLSVLDVNFPESEDYTKGRLGFRQMAPLIGEYKNLVVKSIV